MSSDNAEGACGDAGGSRGIDNAREQDRFLPIANISRIMKKALPVNAKIAKDAKDTVQECVSEFISFITSEASDKCQREKRKTINGEDLLWALGTLGFEDYVEPLKLFLQKHREFEGDKNAGGARGGSEEGKKDGFDHNSQVGSPAPGYAESASVPVHILPTMVPGAVVPHHPGAIIPGSGASNSMFPPSHQ